MASELEPARRMASLMFRAAIFILAIGALGGRTWAVTYSAKILEPPNLANHAKAYGATVGAQVGIYDSGGGSWHALVWTSMGPADLQSAGYHFSEALGVSEGTQVGSALTTVDGLSQQHALLWRGSAESVVDLNPAGFRESSALGVSGGTQVGWARGPGSERAMLWRDTAASAVNLNPAGHAGSQALAVAGEFQAGFTHPATGTVHAALWNKTAESFVDLHPSGWKVSAASAVAGDLQAGIVGQGTFGTEHAALWRGTSANFIDVHPVGYSASYIRAAAGAFQVGYGTVGGLNRALAWSGTAESIVNLHQFLPAGRSFQNSWAYSVAADGTIVGYAGGSSKSSQYAILWTPVVPEPATGALVLASTLFMASVRYRWGSRRPVGRNSAGSEPKS